VAAAASPFRVALTFDAEHPDRPARPGNDERLLDALAAAGVRATFFVQGRWAEACPATARRIATDGHLVGSHTFYHARLPLLSADGLATDMRDAEAAILEHVGVDPRPWFRCPFGAGALDDGLLAGVAALGYGRHAGWHVDTEDWTPGRTADTLTRIVVDGTTRNGDETIVLMHSWPDPTPVAVPEIVRRLADAGATFVTIADLPNPRSRIPADDPQ
jgi:peptidoglycan/xylan/chitin deacetylase (PgdA/CDA1 family)